MSHAYVRMQTLNKHKAYHAPRAGRGWRGDFRDPEQWAEDLRHGRFRHGPLFDAESQSLYVFISFFSADESGCEADMAEGGQDEDSGDVMLAGGGMTAAAVTSATKPRDQDQPTEPIALNLKAEVSQRVKSKIFLSSNIFG